MRFAHYRHARGHTLTQAIHRRQVREALALLRDTALNVDEIAGASGFQDPRYFRRIFSRYPDLRNWGDGDRASC